MTDTTIAAVLAWEALDSRGNPTVGCEVRLGGGSRGEATVPAGASTGRHEARELRDGGERYRGRGVRTAAGHAAGVLADAVRGLDATDQQEVDDALRHADGTQDLRRTGANAVLAVSVAAAVAAARAVDQPLWRAVCRSEPLLPLPMVNIISGGAHAGRSIDVQDFLAVPLGARRFSEAIEWAWRVRAGTAEEMAERGLPTALIADEGGLSAALSSNRAALDLLVRGIERAGLRAGEDVGIAIDIAATQFVSPEGTYVLAAENRELSAWELVEELREWCGHYPIVSLEDALAEDDWDGWRTATERLGDRQLLGDDLFATNPARLTRGIDAGVANAVLVKPNQIGTLSSARTVVSLAEQAGYATVLSARSGETEDSWLADLAVGWRTGQLKIGSTMRSERTAKWNRLLRIEAELGADNVRYAGAEVIIGCCLLYLKASAFAGDPMPPGALSGAAVRNISWTPSCSQSAARSSVHHSSPSAMPNWPMSTRCRKPVGVFLSGGKTSTANVSDATAATWASQRYSHISSPWTRPGVLISPGTFARSAGRWLRYQCANPVCRRSTSPSRYSTPDRWRASSTSSMVKAVLVPGS
jgi:enolase